MPFFLLAPIHFFSFAFIVIFELHSILSSFNSHFVELNGDYASDCTDYSLSFVCFCCFCLSARAIFCYPRLLHGMEKNESKIKFNHSVEVALFEPIICFLLYNLFLISFNFVHIFIQLEESSCNLNIEKSIVLILMHDQKKAVVNGDSFSGFIRRAHSSDKNAFYQ